MKNTGAAGDPTRSRHGRKDAAVRVQHFLPAPPSVVYRCFTDATLIREWWGGREGGCVAAESDPRVDGLYRFVYRQRTGKLLITSGRYERLSPPDQLVFTWKWGEPASQAEESLVSVKLFPKGDGTRLVLLHSRLRTQTLRDEHTAGWYDCLGFLAIKLPSQPQLEGRTVAFSAWDSVSAPRIRR